MTPTDPQPLVVEEDPVALQAGRDAARALRKAAMDAMVRENPFADPPEVCAARAADPEWQSEQAAKSDAASARFAEYRDGVGLPIVRKKAGERF